MVVRIFFLVSILTGTLLPKYSDAQIDDIGIWTGISIQKQFTRKVEGSLTEQLRLNHDASTINLLLTDVGVEYAISKKFKAGIHYRFINANQVTYYSKRHRFYADLSFKEKIKTVSFTIRERIQEQFYDYYSSETGKIPYWTLRSKLTVKIDLKKKITPYFSGEIYYQIDNPKQ